MQKLLVNVLCNRIFVLSVIYNFSYNLILNQMFKNNRKIIKGFLLLSRNNSYF